MPADIHSACLGGTVDRMTVPEVDAVLEITVARVGGIAGARRRWSVTPERPQLADWRSLVESCPWDAVSAEQAAARRAPGGDRFVWIIEVHLAETHHEAELPESSLTGPWRELVDRVRADRRAEHEPGRSRPVDEKRDRQGG